MPYIDLSQGTNGTGTKVNPYNTFTELNALSGDQGNAHWFIRAGGKVTGEQSVNANAQIYMTTAVSNLFIGTYGGDTKPILLADKLVTTAWTASNGLYKTNIGLGKETALFVGEYKLHRTTSQAACLALLYSSYYDSGTDTHYVNVGGAPTAGEMTYTALQYALRIFSATNVTVKDLVVKNSAGSTAVFDNIVSGVRILSCESYGAGSWNTSLGPGDGFVMFGPANNATPATGCAFIGNTTHLTNNNIAEFRNHDGLVVEDNYGSDCSIGYELWGFVKNSFFRYNKAENIVQSDRSLTGHQNMFWLTSDTQGGATVTGSNTGNLFEYNIGKNVRSHVDCETTSDSNTFNNNIFDSFPVADSSDSGLHLLFSINKADSIVVKNNIFYIKDYPYSAPSVVFHSQKIPGTSPTIATIYDYNHYFADSSVSASHKYWKINDIQYATLSSYNTATGQEANGSEGADPGFADRANWDYSISASSPAYQTGVNVSATRDIRNVRINTAATPNMGAYENRIKPAESVSIRSAGA